MRLLLILLGLLFILKADELDLVGISKFEKGIKRDFYLNEYLKKEINQEQAFETLLLVNNVSNEIFFNFAKKFNHDETLAVAQCMNMSINEVINSYDDCIVSRLSLIDISSLSQVQIELISQKIQYKYPTLTKKLKLFSSSIPFTKLVTLETDDFYDIYFNVSDEFRIKYFDYKLPSKTFKRIFKDKGSFDKYLEITLVDLRLKRVAKNIFDLTINDKGLSSNSSFLLALNALRFNDTKKAVKYLDNANYKTNTKRIKDKILFWKYLITKENHYLSVLSSSTDLNLYSLYASELLKKEFNDFNTLLKYPAFDKLLEIYDIKRVSTLYAISKVKSDFQLNKISKDFDLGITQLNYHFIKSTDSNIDPFTFENNIKLANIYLDKIQNKKEDLSLKSSLYSPFLSLEFISNGKKEYIKEILMYRYLYENYLGKKDSLKISLSTIFENLQISYLK